MKQATVAAARNPVLRRIIKRVVSVANPDRVILFGSRAYGNARPDSDYDLLVVYSGKLPCRRVSMSIHRNLFGIPAAVDVHVIPPDILARYANSPALIYRDILRRGVQVYAA